MRVRVALGPRGSQQIDPPVDFAAVSASVYRPDVYREAAAPLGIPVPLVDAKEEGVHDGPWLLGEATSPIAMGPDAFLDGRTFDPDDPLAYVAAAPSSGGGSRAPARCSELPGRGNATTSVSHRG